MPPIGLSVTERHARISRHNSNGGASIPSEWNLIYSSMAKAKKKDRARKVTVRAIVPADVELVPTVNEVTTTTEVETTPTVEVRKPATLAQALTEPATVVVKPKKKAVARTVRTKRRVA